VAAFIAAQRDEHQIPQSLSCRALGVSRSWFYKWKRGSLPPRAERRQLLAAEVQRLFEEHNGTYGSPRITADLRDAGWRISENTVAQLMRELGLAARRKHKRRSTTRPGKGRWRAPAWSGATFPLRSSTASGTATVPRYPPMRASCTYQLRGIRARVSER
jgi:putative transposase